MTSRGDIKAGAQYDPSTRAVEFHIWAQDAQNGAVFAAQPLAFELVGEGEWRQPSFHLKLENANQLMDDLWTAGVRPTNVRNQSELVSAKEGHIADLRLFATRLLDMVAGADEHG